MRIAVAIFAFLFAGAMIAALVFAIRLAPKSPSQPPSKLRMIAAWLVIIGIFSWGYLHFFKQSERSSIKMLSANFYEIGLTNDGWFDTGVWVPVGKAVIISSNLSGNPEPAQPFEAEVNWKKFSSRLDGHGRFYTSFVTTEDSRTADYQGNVVAMSGQEKVWLKMGDSKASAISLVMEVRDIPAIK